jgi:hypothetical protein
VLTGNFNGDHHSDVLAANVQDSDIDIFLANRNGSLQSAVGYGVSLGPIWMAVGDFNGDHALDLAVANEYGNDVSVLLNTGGTYVSLTSNPNPSQAGQAVQFTATVTPGLAGYGAPTGTVTFMTGRGPIGSASLVNGRATLTYAGFSMGTYWVHAVYSGDAQYQLNRSERLKQVVKAVIGLERNR